MRYNLETHKWEDSNETFKDPNAGLNGPVWCPEGGYFDQVLNKRFETKQEKRDYLKANKLMMHSGSKPQTEGKPSSTHYFIPGLKTNPRYYKNR